MPNQPGTTLVIYEMTVTVDNDGNWSIPAPPPGKPASKCSPEEVLGRMLREALANYEYSPSEGEPSAAYARQAIQYLGDGKILQVIHAPVPPGAVE